MNQSSYSSSVLPTPQTAQKLTPPPLETVTKSCCTTAEAAHYMNRKPQTLRCWAMSQRGDILPNRINGRLLWSIPQIKKLAGVA
jgi:hypothetical protein